METPYAIFQPTGTIGLKANTPTVLPPSNWVSADGSSDPATFFDSNGKIDCSGPFALEIQMCLDLDDLPTYNGSMIVQAIYSPGANSTSKQYIICSLMATQTNKRVIMSNQVPGLQAGDQIYLNFLSSADVSDTISTDQVYSIVSYRDCTNDDAVTYWMSKSGSVPQMAVAKNKVVNMVGANVVNGVATFNLCSDGSATGTSLFPNIISSTPMTLQSLTSDQTLTPPSWFYLPFPVGNQCITAIFSDKSNNNTWSAIVEATGR